MQHKTPVTQTDFLSADAMAMCEGHNVYWAEEQCDDFEEFIQEQDEDELVPTGKGNIYKQKIKIIWDRLQLVYFMKKYRDNYLSDFLSLFFLHIKAFGG